MSRPPTTGAVERSVLLPRLPWGGHLCAFWDTPDALVSLVAAFMAEGLRDNESGFWALPGGVTRATAADAIRLLYPAVDAALAAGDMILMERDEWYAPGGTVDPRALNQRWIATIRAVCAKGRAGLRISGNGEWEGADGWRTQMSLERSANDDLSAQRYRGLCTYELARCTGPQVLDLIALHHEAMVRRDGQWVLLESSAPALPRRELEEAHAESDRRFREKNHQLTTIVDALPGLVAYVDRDERYRFANSRYEEWFGTPVAGMLNRHIRDVLGDAAYRRILPYVRRALGGEEFSYQETLEVGASAPRRLEMHCVPDRGPDGVAGYFVLAQDVTARSAAEDEIARLNREQARRLLELKSVFDLSPIGISLAHDRRCERITVNRAGAEMLGTAAGENVSKSRHADEPLPFRILRDGKEIPSEDLPMQRAAREGVHVHDEELEIVHRDGRIVNVLEYAVPLREENGEIRGAIGVWVDITASKESRRLLEESESRYRTLTNVVGQIIWVMLPSGRVTYVNDRYETYSGVSRDAALGDGWSQIVHPDDAESVVKARAAGLNSGREYSYRVRLRNRDGVYRWHVTRAVPVMSDGRIWSWVGTASDVEELIQVQDALRRSGERLQVALDAGRMGVWEWNLRTDQAEWSASFAELHGWPAERTSGRLTELASQIHPDDWPAVSAAFASVAGAPVPFAIEYRTSDRAGALRWIESRGRFDTDADGHPTVMSGVCLDITDRKETEKELARRAEDLTRSNKELEQFAFVASHDLKEPLRKIAGYAELLSNRYRDKLDEKALRYLDYLGDGVRRMDAIIQDLLAYSRAGRGKDVRDAVDTRALVAQILDDLETTLSEAGAKVELGTLPTVSANPVQLRQVFQNLIANAIKFRAAAPPVIRVDAERTADVWRFSVTDNGIGIEPQYFDRIFEIFQRLHTRNEYPGTGIGLAICKKIVETHGGRIWVESKPGEGSSFRFTLPA